MNAWPQCPLRAQALARPEAEAVVFGSERLTFAQLDRAVTDTAAALQVAGVAPGDCVALRAEACPQLLVHGLALMRLGARVLVLNSRLTPFEVAAQLERVRPRRLLEAWVEPAVSPGGAAEGAGGTVHPSAGLVLFTGGTTGAPKPALLRFRALLAAASLSTPRLGTSAKSRWLCTLPLFHVGGWAMFFRCLVDGSAFVLLKGFDETEVLATLAAECITHVSLVAVMLRRLVERPLPSLRALQVVLVGGGPSPSGLVDLARAQGLPVRLTYGLTEACSQVATQETALGHDVGPALSGLELRIAGDGEIQVRGPTLMQCYLLDEAASRAARDGAWLKTGDFGRLDAQGRLTVLGRRHDLLISGGENVYPAEIEAALLEHPAVKDVGVMALDDVTWGQVPCALVVPRSGALQAFDERALREWCRHRLAGFKIPARFQPVAHLPRNAMGKLDRRALAAMGGQ